MLFVWVVFGIVMLVFIIVFVLANLTMFQATFDIVVRIPSVWEYKWDDVPFIYIVAGSILFGAVVIAISTWVLNTRRKLKIRSQRKELKHLQRELDKVKAALPHQEPVAEKKGTDEPEESSATPEQVSQSFEDTVEEGDFLENFQHRDDTEKPGTFEEYRSQETYAEPEDSHASQEPVEEEIAALESVEEENTSQESPVEDERTPQESVKEERTSQEPIEEGNASQGTPPVEEVSIAQKSVEDEKQLPVETPVEAEIVEPVAGSSEQDETSHVEQDRGD